MHLHDQPELFDHPAAKVAVAPRSGRGRTRETYARAVVADVTVQDVAALRAEALRRLDEGLIVIGEDLGVQDDEPDPRDEVASPAAAALGWCLEPTAGLSLLLDSDAAQILDINLSLDEVTEVLVRASWTVTIKVRDAPAARELALAA